MDTKLTESSRKKSKERNTEWVRLGFCRMSAKDLITVSEVGAVLKDEVGKNT